MKKETKLLMGVCNSQAEVPAQFTWSTLLMRYPVPVQIARSGHPWDVVRNNRLIKQFLDSDCDYFVKMDIDQSYPADYLEVMLPLAEKYKCIGPLIYDRSGENSFMPLSFASHDYPHLTRFDIEGKSGIVEIPYPHTNLFYSREVLENLKPPWYEAHMQPDGLDRANHVDFTFLQKIKDAGYPIYINLDVVVSHASIIYLDRRFSETWQKGMNT